MTANRRLAKVCARFVPADRRDRCREEWLADLDHCSAIGVRTATVVFGVLSMTLQSQKARLRMTRSTQSPPLVKAVGLQIVCMALVLVGVQGAYSWWSSALWGVGTACAVWVAVVAAHSAVRTPAESRASSAVSASLTACIAVLVAAVVEINLHFEAVDTGSANQAVVAIMIVTGFAGVAALLTLAGAGMASLQSR